MSQSESIQDNITEYVLIQIDASNQEQNIQKAIGLYKSEEDAYAEALTQYMQSIENKSDKWSKSMISEKQPQIIELCRYIKEDLSSFKDRFNHITTEANIIFNKDLYNIQYKVLPVKMNESIQQSLNESVFKTKVRNFLDVFQTKSDIEEDLGNSDDDEDDEEEEEDLEEDLEDEEDEEDVEEEEEDEEEDLEEDEAQNSENIVPETEGSSEEEEELEDEDEEEGNSSSLKRSNIEDDDEEDEIDEDGDEDELDDDDENAVAKRRRITEES